MNPSIQPLNKDNLTAVERRLEGTSMEGLTALAYASIPVSLALFAAGRRQAGLLVGMWAPTLLTAAFYNRWLRTAMTVPTHMRQEMSEYESEEPYRPRRSEESFHPRREGASRRMEREPSRDSGYDGSRRRREWSEEASASHW